MSEIRFNQLPLILRVAVGLVFYNTWWLLEEFVIDRYGIWKSMPGYRVGDPCIWDAGVAAIIVLSIWRMSRKSGAAAAIILALAICSVMPSASLAQAPSDSYAMAHPVAFTSPAFHPHFSDRPITNPGSLGVSAIRSPAPERASRFLIAVQAIGGTIGAVVVGAIAYKAFDNPADRRPNGDDPYSPKANTAYAVGSFLGSTAAVHWIGMSDGSRAPLHSTAIGTGIATVPLLALRRTAIQPIIGVIVVAPLQGLFGAAGYQFSRRPPPDEIPARGNLRDEFSEGEDAGKIVDRGSVPIRLSRPQSDAAPFPRSVKRHSH